jgi:hypothetical protein
MSINHEAPCYVVFSTPVTSSLFSSNILHSTLFSNTLSLCSSLNVRYQYRARIFRRGKPGHRCVFCVLRMNQGLHEKCSPVMLSGRGIRSCLYVEVLTEGTIWNISFFAGRNSNSKETNSSNLSVVGRRIFVSEKKGREYRRADR